MDRVVQDIGDGDYIPGLTYVAMPRKRSLFQILFQSPFSFDRLQKSIRASLEKRLREMVSRGVRPTNNKLVPNPIELPKARSKTSRAANVDTLTFKSPNMPLPQPATLPPIEPHPHFRTTYEAQNSIVMQPSNFSYVPVDAQWQITKCNDLGLQYSGPNGCLPGGPGQPLTTPRTAFTIVGDGACFFRSLSHIITGNQDQHLAIRLKVCDHMMLPEVDQWLAGRYHHRQDTTATDHIRRQNMRMTSTWATTAEIFTASDLLQTQIVIADSRNRSWMLFSPRHRPWGQFVETEGSVYMNYVPARGIARDCNHYEVIRSIS